MPELTTEERERLDRGDFAYVDRDGGEHLPIHDREHARNAISRWNQTHFESAEAREAARRRSWPQRSDSGSSSRMMTRS